MIVPVKKAKIFIMEEDKVELLLTLQKHNILMVSNNEQVDTKYEDDYINRAQYVLNELTKYQEKKPFFEYFEVNYDEYILDDIKRFDLLDSLESDLKRLNQLKKLNEDIIKQKELIDPFSHMPYSLNDLTKSLYVTFKVGYVSEKDHEQLVGYFNENKIEHEFYELSNYGYPLIFVLDKDEEVKQYSEIESLGFSEASLPKLDKKVRRELEELDKSLNNNLLEIKTIEEKLINSKEYEKELRILIDQLESKKERMNVSFSETEQTVYLEGWVREDHVEKLKSLVQTVTDTFDIDFSEPREDDLVPTATNNNKFVSQFETITNMFSVPKHDEVDPNPVMSVWYWLIFGIMMGDIGYGLLMVLGLGLFIKFKKPKGSFSQLVHVLYYSGYTSIVAGIVFGSLFGFEVKILELIGLSSFSVKEDPITMLIFSVGLGVLHLVSGLILKMKLAIKHGDVLTALADGLSWTLIMLGAVVAILGMMVLELNAVTYIGLGLVGVGVVLILALAGREKKGVFSKVTAGLGGIYGVTSYLSDLLSYSRILALSLSTAIIAETMNLLASLLHGSWYGWIFALAIYVVGHVFNFAMGLLSAYVHDSRLQYIEFFGKFYEGGGTEFKPLSLKTDYINEITY